MKRIIILLLAVSMLLTLILPMTACGDETARLERMSGEKQARRLLKLAEESLTEAEQAVIYRTLNIRNPYFGATVSETETISYVMTKDNYGYLKQTHTRLGAGETIKSTSVYGYKDGYVFSHHTQDEVSSFFKAPVDEKDFRAVTVKDSDLPPMGLFIGEDTCKTVTAEHMDNGKWKVVCEDFGDAKAASFLGRQHDYASDLTASHKPWDLTVTLVMSPELVPTLVTVDVIFHPSKEYPNAEPTAQVQYSFTPNTSDAWNNISSIPLEKYTELSDLSLLTSFFDGLTAREKAARGELSVDTTTTVKSGGESQSATLTQSLTYGSAGGYRFTYNYEEPDGKRYELAYAGTRLLQTTYGKMGNKIETKSARMIDAHARLTVAGAMNPQSVTPADIESVRMISAGSGTYRYTLREDAAKNKALDLLREVFPKTIVKVTSASAILEAQMPNGVLEYHTLTLYTDALIDDEPVTLEITVNILFYE